ncbi:MAG TPA: MBL fold metallo-hydrolase [Streptosporangiaceae bacterium]|nr:MBL fold metallo-hydrolase [Streptosporangiaceae bacterium]
MHRLTEVATGVLVATSARYVTTSTVITARDGGCLVIDPAVTVPDLRLLAEDLAEAGLRPRAGFATHPHWDHIMWCRELGNAPRYAAPRAVETARRERAGLIDDVERSAPGHDLDLFGRLTPLVPGSASLPWDGPEALILTHDGHAPGHSAVFLPDSGTLVAGDMCSDIEIPLLDLDQPDPVGDYRAGLDLLAALPVRLLIPGHGNAGDGAEFRRRVAADIAYLDALEHGRDPGDPRLSLDWLTDEHQRHVRHLHG